MPKQNNRLAKIPDPLQAIAVDNAQAKAKIVFDLLDVSKTTRQDYKYRIGLFLEFTRKNSINVNSYLDFKRYLATRLI